MKVNQSIFKSYDIRGIYPTELKEETAYQIGRAFVQYTGAKKIAVAQDGRVSSPAIFKKLTQGIIDQGGYIYDIGQTPTECLYFAINYYEAGIMITASHNSKEYNGFKMVKKTGKDIEIIRGKDILKTVQSDFKESSEKGRIEKKNIWPDYLKHIFSFVSGDIKKFKVVIDSSSGVAANVVFRIKGKLPIEIISLNDEVDGNFLHHPPNPLLKGATDEVRKEIKKKKADFGFIFDGDADRIFLLDEKGKFVPADITLLLLAKYFLTKEPGVAIAYNAICSKAVPEFIEKWGGKAIRTKVGFVNVREGLMENNGVMGGELSGHYSFRDNSYLDSGFIVLLILLELFSKSDKKVSEITSELSLYAKSSEINFEVKDKEAILERAKKKYSNGKQDFLDGITVEYDNWWFNIRPSQTEPLLRLTIEADNKKLLEEKKKELTDFIEE